MGGLFFKALFLKVTLDLGRRIGDLQQVWRVIRFVVDGSCGHLEYSLCCAYLYIPK